MERRRAGTKTTMERRAGAEPTMERRRVASVTTAGSKTLRSNLETQLLDLHVLLVHLHEEDLAQFFGVGDVRRDIWVLEGEIDGVRGGTGLCVEDLNVLTMERSKVGRHHWQSRSHVFHARISPGAAKVWME